MTIVPLYAAILGLLFFALSLRIIGLRGRLRIGLGDNGHPRMLRAMRVHANFAEYVPLCLVLLGFAEVQGTSTIALHSLGSGLVLGRALHAYGLGQTREYVPLRVVGMMLTFTCLVSSCAIVAVQSLRG